LPEQNMPHTIFLASGLLLSAIATTNALTLGATARTFSVCAATTVTNSGATVLTGPLGLSPGTSYTGFPPGVASAFEVGSASAIACEAQAATTYGSCTGLAPTRDLTGVPLGGKTLTAGVYKFDTTADLSGVLTLDGRNKATAQFIFIIGTSFNTAVGSQIVLINKAKACNVFFCVGSSATIGANNVFKGSLIAYTSIAVGTGTSDMGGFFALNGAVTLLTNNVVPPGTC